MSLLRDQLIQCTTEKQLLQDQVERHQADALDAIRSERNIRQQLTRTKLESGNVVPKLKALQTIRQSESSESRQSSRFISTPESDHRVQTLSNLCDKIFGQQVHFTRHICRKFELGDLLVRGSDFQLLPKHELMSKLEEYENLVNAMSALFFVSRGMQHVIPVVF